MKFNRLIANSYRDNLNEMFNLNVTGVHEVTRAFLPLLRRGEKKAVINMLVVLNDRLG